MDEIIKNILSKYNCNYIEINNQNSLGRIHNLLLNKLLFEPSNDIEMLYLGIYYHTIEQNYDLMVKYYLMAIDKDNYIAMDNLASYYEIIENYNLAEKYYLMSINKGNVNSMANLGFYYLNKENYDFMKKYFIMASNNG